MSEKQGEKVNSRLIQVLVPTRFHHPTLFTVR